MNQMPNYMEPHNFYEAPIYPPYFYQPIVPPQPQMFMKRRLAGPQLASTLRTAQKTISTVTKIIPIVYQIQPVLNNAKTAIRVAKAVKVMSNTDKTNDEPIDVTPITKEEIKTDSNNPYIP